MSSLGSFSDVPPDTTPSTTTSESSSVSQTQKEETPSELLIGLIETIGDVKNCIHLFTKYFLTLNCEDSSIEKRSFLHSNFLRSGPSAFFDSSAKKLYCAASNNDKTAFQEKAVELFGDPVFLIEVDDENWQSIQKNCASLQKEEKQQESDNRYIDQLVVQNRSDKEKSKNSKDDNESENIGDKTNKFLLKILALAMIKLLILQNIERQREKAEDRKEEQRTRNEEYNIILHKVIKDAETAKAALFSELQNRTISEEEKRNFLKDLHQYGLSEEEIKIIQI